MSGWRPALLIAWRDALRHKGRSALVLVMISLPVLAVSAAAVMITTAEITGIEGADRRLGAAAARVRTEGRGQVVQDADPSRGGWMQVGDFDYEDPLDAADVQAVLGDGARLVPIAVGWQRVRLGDKVISFSTTGVDLSDPVAEGLFEVAALQYPEVAFLIARMPRLDTAFTLNVSGEPAASVHEVALRLIERLAAPHPERGRVEFMTI